MGAHTQRKVIDLDLTKDNELLVPAEIKSNLIKCHTNCEDTYILKTVSGGKIFVTQDDMEFLGQGLIIMKDDFKTISTDYYINSNLVSCTDTNAANISKLRATIQNLKLNSGNLPENGKEGQIITIDADGQTKWTDINSLSSIKEILKTIPIYKTSIKLINEDDEIIESISSFDLPENK